ncbi:MAG: hypothetical protein IPP39_10205 [Chitinophagaceae bacterium]|nr:hypothetical protein [Chitinophagaceae bacterium]
MIKKLAGEVWKPLTFSGWKHLRNRYAVSSLGRIASYKQDILKEGKVLSGSLTTGYRTLNLHRPNNKGTLYIHREMAKIFLEKILRAINTSFTAIIINSIIILKTSGGPH